jgi:hypothetical protein
VKVNACGLRRPQDEIQKVFLATGCFSDGPWGISLYRPGTGLYLYSSLPKSGTDCAVMTTSRGCYYRQTLALR